MRPIDRAEGKLCVFNAHKFREHEMCFSGRAIYEFS